MKTLTKIIAVVFLLAAFTSSYALAGAETGCCREIKLCCKTSLAVNDRHLPALAVKKPDFKLIHVVLVNKMEPAPKSGQEIDFTVLDKEMEMVQQELSDLSASFSLRNLAFEIEMDDLQAKMSTIEEKKPATNDRIDFNQLEKEMDLVQLEMSRID
ncbi:MAG: hypothetical protein K0Q66_953 [Chitinophagaceae bacterium]|jgi:hypothetical protein|nr:hypothetical protein [Chitinophagaceae bacterium]